MGTVRVRKSVIEGNRTMHPLLTELHGGNPYDGFVPQEESVTGWGGLDPVFDTLVKRVRPRMVFEVGSWKGQSALTMAGACAALGLNCCIVCIDTWLGSEEHVLLCPKELRRVHGYPTLYYQFLSNVVRRGAQDAIVPFAATSLVAASVLRTKGVCADLIYIDAHHDYASVAADIEAYFSLLDKGGIMFGHDYAWDSVRRAVNDCSHARGLQVGHQNDFWILESWPVTGGD
jgi:predicted O-methyltransferase YrrM